MWYGTSRNRLPSAPSRCAWSAPGRSPHGCGRPRRPGGGRGGRPVKWDLPGTERAVEIGGLRGVPVEGCLDEAEGLVEVLQEAFGDDVVRSARAAPSSVTASASFSTKSEVEIDVLMSMTSRRRGAVPVAFGAICVSLLLVPASLGARERVGLDSRVSPLARGGDGYGWSPRGPGVLSSVARATGPSRVSRDTLPLPDRNVCVEGEPVRGTGRGSGRWGRGTTGCRSLRRPFRP
ncbi:hypothetical protein SANTM175S_03918 [Streptomyces antimycoticus]